ncbi:MAG TPA: hypothetical protein VG248_19370 [Caulobacteraceae bacterium]|jgi:tetratricopeptide (TPR) repeat protein|nr:hypothetical protein [Caulobacteraceae bacterium]
MRIGTAAAAAAILAAATTLWSSGRAADARDQAPAAPAEHAMPMPAGPPATLEGWTRGARLFEGLGDFHRKATTANAEAQAYFDQGMRLTWAFNHDEATRSFAKAAALDPDCAACFWGVALTLGPNYNLATFADPRARVGWEALQKAKAALPHASPVERALIEAVAARYAGPQGQNESAVTSIAPAYAAAMAKVAAQFPDDLDVQTLYAEALMDKNPWKLWDADGATAADTPLILDRLKFVLARDPRHLGANHYYVHAVEASKHPEDALVSAERLRTLAPAAGHIDHMPAHIFQRVGRYEDSVIANQQGAKADLAYYALSPPPDYYPMYTGHNYQFLAFSAAMEGNRAETIEALRRTRQTLPDDMLMGMPGIDWQVGFLYQAMVRFGLWDEILAEPEANPKLIGLRASYLEARASALAAKGRIAEARSTSDELAALLDATPADSLQQTNTARDLFAIALLKARARIALAEHKPQAAVALLEQAVAAEDKLAYDEPADCFYPTRHLLGAALLAAGEPAKAEAVYRRDLALNPANGWSLKGLELSLRAQGRAADADAAAHDLAKAWTHADGPVLASAAI